MLERARAMLEEVRSRVPGLAEAIDWRSPAATEFRDALGDWAIHVDSIVGQLGRWDAELVRAHAELAAEARVRTEAPPDPPSEWRPLTELRGRDAPDGRGTGRGGGSAG
jgi:hypothetical protein